MAAVPGAAELIGALESSGRWRAGIASGTWRRCARWKLGLAGIDPDALALATADDAHDRAEIVLIAIRRAIGMPTPAAPAKACHPGQGVPPERIVYLGDGLWDWHTARRLGIGFVGVAAGGDSRRLSQASVGPLVEDFLAPHRVLRLLDAAARAPTPALLAALAGCG
jgi:phosphoglycolate phosphatase-like HAD superfamily hydrolase